MKKITLLAALFCILIGYAQEEKKEKSKFDFEFTYKIGSSNLRNSEVGVLNGNIQGFSLQSSYMLFEDSILDDIRLQFGLQFMEFNSGLVLNNLNATLSNNYIQAPLGLIFSTSKNRPYRFNIGGGVIANYFLRSELFELAGSSKDNINRITFGYFGVVGFDFYINEKFFVGFNVGSQGDYSSIRTNGVSNRLVRARYAQISLGFDF